MIRRSYLLFILIMVALSYTAHAQGWIWARGNTGTQVDAWPVATDPNGNVFVAGINFGYTPVMLGSVTVPNAGVSGLQCIIAKYDSGGHVLWAKGTQNGNANLIGITTDLHGNSFLLGTISGHSVQIGSYTLTNPYTLAGDVPYFIAKFDPSGNVLWAITAGNAQVSFATIGGFSYVLGLGGITTDAGGNVYVTTSFHKPTVTIGTATLTNADPSGKTDDILIVKYGPTGNFLWASQAGGMGNDNAYGITVTPAGDVYIGGVFGSRSISFGSSVITGAATIPGGQVAFIARFDQAGNAVWGCSSGGNGGEYAVGIASDPNNNVYLTGGLKDNSISFAGTTITNPTPGKPVLYLTKFDQSNNVSWYKVISSASPALVSGAWGYSISMSPCGVIWVSGSMVDSVNIDGHILATPTNTINHDTIADPVFIAGYTAAGNYLASAALISGADDQNGIACDALGNVYMCADYLGHLNFTAGRDVLPKDPTNDEMLYVTKYASINPTELQTKSSYTTLCSGADVMLSAPTGYHTCIWSDGSRGTTRHVSDAGIFCVASLDSCVSFSYDTFNVQACNCSDFLFVPNTFTPNGDGENDVFYPRCSPGVSLISSFRVYNRWGVLVFERENLAPNDLSNAWDGTYNNPQPTTEVFVWVVDAVCQDGSTFSKKGSITAVR